MKRIETLKNEIKNTLTLNGSVKNEIIWNKICDDIWDLIDLTIENNLSNQEVRQLAKELGVK